MFERDDAEASNEEVWVPQACGKPTVASSRISLWLSETRFPAIIKTPENAK
jgi:hypothetical protein